MSTLAVDNVRPSLGGTTANLMDALVKAHAKYDQTVPSISRSANITSITDVGVGDWTTNFTNNFDAADYEIAGCVEGQSDVAGAEAILWAVPGGQTTSSDDNRASSGAGGAVDTTRTCPSYRGDLA